MGCIKKTSPVKRKNVSCEKCKWYRKVYFNGYYIWMCTY